jgi:hypothetical protein
VSQHLIEVSKNALTQVGVLLKPRWLLVSNCKSQESCGRCHAFAKPFLQSLWSYLKQASELFQAQMVLVEVSPLCWALELASYQDINGNSRKHHTYTERRMDSRIPKLRAHQGWLGNPRRSAPL